MGLPSLWSARFFLGAVTILSGDTEGGIALCEEALRSNPSPVAEGAQAVVSGFTGNTERAREILARLLCEHEDAPFSPVAIAWACVGAQDERVFGWLDRCIDEREPVILHLPHLPIYDGIAATRASRLSFTGCGCKPPPGVRFAGRDMWLPGRSRRRTGGSAPAAKIEPALSPEALLRERLAPNR